MAVASPAYGLVPKGKGASLPLKSVSVEAKVRGFVLGLHSTLTYSNDASDPAEVLFRFPVEKSHAVVGLTAVVDGRKITADIREKEEARAQYDDAIASGLSAALAEEKSGDVFSVALGNLPPGKEAQIHLQLVGELGIDAEGGIRFSLPATLKPRYTPAGSTDPLASVPGGEEQQVKSGTVPAVSWFHMTVEGAESVSEVTSPTHSITITPNDANQLDVRLSKDLECDLVILVKMKEPHAPKAVVEGSVDKKGESMSNPAVMLNFFPQFPDVQAACEFIFVVDRSGSMLGSYIQSACDTLVLFLKSIPEGNYFNIIGFGSSYQSLFPNTVPYDQEHLEKAMKHVQEMQADLGGTELLTPLQHVFGMKPRSGYARQIFVLTDGSVSNTQACIQQMKSNVKSARCFTFGIGSGASTALVEGLAQAGNGTAEFVKEGERMQPKVILSLKRALQPAVTEVSVVFQVPKEYEVVQCPASLPPIFNGEKLVSYAVLKSKKAPKKAVSCTAILKGNMLGKKQEHTIPFTIDGSVPAPSLPVIHHLAAKALITDLEIEGKEKKSIVDLSIESSVISSHTAFIAIDEESSEPMSGALKTYDVQTQMPICGFFSYISTRAIPMSASRSMAYRASGGCGGYRSLPFRGVNVSKAKKCSKQVRETCTYNASAFPQPTHALYANMSLNLYKKCAGPPPPAMASGSKPTNTFEDLITSQQAPPLALYIPPPLPPPLPPPRSKSLCAGAAPVPLSLPDIPPPLPPPRSKRLCEGELEYELESWSEGEGGERVLEQRTEKKEKRKAADRDTGLNNLITAQKVDGSWALTSSFAQLVGKSLSDLETGCPIERKGAGATVWATVLAVSLLRARYSSQQEEWELIAMKAESWLKKQTLPSGCTLEQLFQAAQKQF